MELFGWIEKALGETNEKAGRDHLGQLKIVKERKEGERMAFSFESSSNSSSSGGCACGTNRTMDGRYFLSESSEPGLVFETNTI